MSGISESPIFEALKQRLNFLESRQKLISENVANATTPNYTPRDLDEQAFVRQLERNVATPSSFQLARSDAQHLSGAQRSAPTVARIISAPDTEATLDGNRVVLEDQMFKMNRNRMDFETAIGVYQKALQIVRLAARAPGR